MKKNNLFIILALAIVFVFLAVSKMFQKDQVDITDKSETSIEEVIPGDVDTKKGESEEVIEEAIDENVLNENLEKKIDKNAALKKEVKDQGLKIEKGVLVNSQGAVVVTDEQIKERAEKGEPLITDEERRRVFEKYKVFKK